MLLNKKNLVSELLYERNKLVKEEELLQEVKSILERNDAERMVIRNTLQSKSSTNVNVFVFDHLETDKIFHLSQIKNVCIDYRLRFLDSYLFKNTIPEEAVTNIRNLEKTHKTKLEGFKIMAPSKAFNLISYDDPLLFAPLGNDYYYLIHKWGNDLNWYRKISVMPFKSTAVFVLFCLILSVVGTFLIPKNHLSESVELAPIIIFLFLFKSIIATIAYYFFMMGKNFNDVIWNRTFKEN